MPDELLLGDWVLGGLALLIALGGLWMLAGGVSSMGDRQDR